LAKRAGYVGKFQGVNWTRLIELVAPILNCLNGNQNGVGNALIIYFNTMAAARWHRQIRVVKQ